MRIAARYLPPEAGLEVGGDWYDVIRSAAGRLEIVIGDVAGRGVPAAAVMGRVATALRAYAIEGRPVEVAVAGLDELMKELESSQMTTLFQLSLDLDSGEARYVRAGHPPALLRLPGGEVSTLEGVGSPPVGVLRDARFVANATTLPPGSTILLYTDGLIERRELDLQVGIERLQEAFAAAPAEPDAIVEAILLALDAEAVPDDIALLAASFTGVDAGT
jgi:serine phosphatase RsbU (regulator of sigma subunit)